ncbi:hypothetical protein B0H19DRAFT_1083515 [Mycena capillaripes]|nr:hypothetical protein B0H19DRAFT_1083515 [Mycena capillaripes]
MKWNKQVTAYPGLGDRRREAGFTDMLVIELVQKQHAGILRDSQLNDGSVPAVKCCQKSASVFFCPAEVLPSQTVKLPGIAIIATSSEDIGVDGLVVTRLRWSIPTLRAQRSRAAISFGTGWCAISATPEGKRNQPLQCVELSIRILNQNDWKSFVPSVFVLFREPANFSPPEGASEFDPTIEARHRRDAVKFGKHNGLQMAGAAPLW